MPCVNYTYYHFKESFLALQGRGSICGTSCFIEIGNYQFSQDGMCCQCCCGGEVRGFIQYEKFFYLVCISWINLSAILNCLMKIVYAGEHPEKYSFESAKVTGLTLCWVTYGSYMLRQGVGRFTYPCKRVKFFSEAPLNYKMLQVQKRSTTILKCSRWNTV